MFTQIALILSLIILIFFIYKFAMFKPQVVFNTIGILLTQEKEKY